MESLTIKSIEAVVDYIESHLDEKLDLETVAAAVHYSKFHLHRMFSDALGMTIHDYAVRRRLSEAAKLLVFSQKPIIEIACICGYESQQAFSAAFKSMYKIPPAEYRARKSYYPLLLRFTLHEVVSAEFLKTDIRLAELSDIPCWLELLHLVVDGYPCLNEDDYVRKLSAYIAQKQALILRQDAVALGVMAFSYDTGSIDFMGVHPQYRNRGIQKLFLDTLMEDYLPGRVISTTTYREHDKADTGYRAELKRLGFAERELLVEFGYPTQKLILPPRGKGAGQR